MTRAQPRKRRFSIGAEMSGHPARCPWVHYLHGYAGSAGGCIIPVARGAGVIGFGEASAARRLAEALRLGSGEERVTLSEGSSVYVIRRCPGGKESERQRGQTDDEASRY